MWYGSQGYLVFPLRPGLKVPATPHGFKDATTDPGKIRAWWTGEPHHNIGLATGHKFDVIDVDGQPGLDSMLAMEERAQIPPVLGYVATPRGYHLYITPTGDGCTTAVLPGIDYRGVGGYVVAPPSLTVEGDSWKWLQPLGGQS